MKSLEAAYDLIESLNEEAHQRSWDSWVAADELSESADEDDWETAEEMREDASIEQASYFRDNFYDLEEEDQETIRHWVKEDSDFREQLSVYYGEEEFENEFEY